MKKNSIITITETAKQSFLKLCSRELKKRKDNDYIDVDVEYTEKKEKKSSINWGNWLAGFLASAMTLAVLSYSFILFKIIYFIAKSP